MGVYLFTGFPGFLAKQLVRELAKKEKEAKIYLLVLPSQLEKANEELSLLQYHHIQFEIIEGDITKEMLKIDSTNLERIYEEVEYVFHLAAIYDLAVKKDVAYRVNVIGTRNVIQFIKKITHLKRLIYFSTAYVAGLRKGTIYEYELDRNQSFRNHYEETKFWAEVEVQREMEQIPTTIIRPGIVIGDSLTGETAKFDGPYMILNFLQRLRYSPIIPYLHKENVELNVVPVDYIVQATIFLAHTDETTSKVFHLTNPNPIGTKEAYALMARQLLNKRPFGVFPLFLSKALLSFSFIRRWLMVEKEALDYFTCKSNYDCSEAVNYLRRSGIKCANFNSTVDTMVQYYKKHQYNKEKRILIK
ncbi:MULTISPECIES: SDR family oxidoreductase [Sutcliffiella]|uniref:Thioester reductase (TE) domain-containing protein n=1 Tax=Sutcliffiella cohnii TaxID=33932 RepID=A0A223KPY6_9BACI|nr:MULTISPECIES: SDR family oxidoreductase [Sutcliffiella]AST91414.1 hypothetical protein BC6307_09030 [Sutcliffiella cohnii]MED4015030.1 SDR family oxidoreductase [Sutcliffiella cohnii]WBL17240.1 SDR family oxidoreductase [Sutcliffiella sp. NC1]